MCVHFRTLVSAPERRILSEKANILIVDDDQDILLAGRLLLERHFSEVHTTSSPAQIPDLMENKVFDAIMLDMNFSPSRSSGEEGFEWLQQILSIDPQMVVVMITAHGGVNTAVEAMKLGATDFVAKPWHNEKVIATISAAVKLSKSRRESSALRQTNQILSEASAALGGSIIGSSAPMQAVYSMVERTAPTDANVLILGENGTGKELIAREMHRQSLRADQAFLAIDMGSISESLFESELFGHKKGAFTGAAQDRVGRIKAADGGTLFLDEVGNLPLNLQVKLLRVLEQRSLTPLGSDQLQSFDVRVISATNLPTDQLHDESRFRTDLLFRLNTVEITLPSLRERKADILLIAKYYLDLYSRKYHKDLQSFSPAAEKALMDDSWPGNVRALRHAIERAVILSVSEQIESADLQLSETGNDAAHKAPLNLEQLEKETVHKALRKHAFNISKTAKELGLTRASLYRRMEKHDL